MKVTNAIRIMNECFPIIRSTEKAYLLATKFGEQWFPKAAIISVNHYTGSYMALWPGGPLVERNEFASWFYNDNPEQCEIFSGETYFWLEYKSHIVKRQNSQVEIIERDLDTKEANRLVELYNKENPNAQYFTKSYISEYEYKKEKFIK